MSSFNLEELSWYCLVLLLNSLTLVGVRLWFDDALIIGSLFESSEWD